MHAKEAQRRVYNTSRLSGERNYRSHMHSKYIHDFWQLYNTLIFGVT